MILNKEHLTEKGLNKIKKIKNVLRNKELNLNIFEKEINLLNIT